MITRLKTSWRAAALLAQALALLAAACNGKGPATEAPAASKAAAVAAAKAAASVPDCYDTKRATACPPDPSDPSPRRLPTAGSVCAVAPCKPCGSATAPAYRGADGAPTPGFCICVPRSDDSGTSVYSCFPPGAH